MVLLGESSKVIVVLVLIVALFAFVIGILIGLPLQAITLNTKSATANAYGFESRGGNLGGEFFDASSYVTSWSPNLDSEKIVIKAEGTRHFGALSCAVAYRYRVYTTSNGLSWNELAASPYTFTNIPVFTSPGTFLPLSAPPPIELRGVYEGGVKIDLEIHIKDVADPTCTYGLDKGFVWIGGDQAYLRSGVGTVRAPPQAEVGDVVNVCVDVPYVASELEPGKGWLLYGFSTAQNREILRVEPIARSGTSCYAYTVAPEDFVQSPSCTTENRLEWHLFNELWSKDFAFTTTVDASSFAPSLRITSIAGDREVGSNIVVSWEATPNPTTQYEILRVVFAYGFGAPDNEVALPPTVTSYTITPGQGGVLHGEVYAVDSACRPSPSQAFDLQIREPGQGGASAIEANVLLFLVPVIGLSVAGILIAAYVPVSTGAKALVVVLFLVLGILAGVLLVPEVLFPGG